ncbi:retrovirus-related pol polyprotein from transposon tnt 1-94 [Gossypium australe]|uniref:Retrovirus-related pol polyprotein from transposon tnt 1-94 n=1 Tax=Gossypium australe TaxID=47621 RepID=A0A5B6VIB8_9ROSI|nr:retrovirus-related pol polyprotein from transposon tnt 1-94 [Gossypium australe]
MENCKGVATPMTSSVISETFFEDASIDGSLYRRIIGKLHYLTFTHPDIAFAINQLSQAMHQPTMSHWVALKRLLRYLHHIATFRLYVSLIWKLICLKIELFLNYH